MMRRPGSYEAQSVLATSSPVAKDDRTLKRSLKERIRSLFNLSQHAADEVFGWANVTLVMGSMLVLAGTAVAIWASGIREQYANERISKNEAETADANKRAAEANAELALTNERVMTERRLTANERWRLSRLEAAVLPRALTPEMTVAPDRGVKGWALPPYQHCVYR
jgi:hypothetical protein